MKEKYGHDAHYCSVLCLKVTIMLDYAAFPVQRQERIKKNLEEYGRVICTDLANELGVSEHTIRRDLTELSKEGLCKKVYGGAVSKLNDPAHFEARRSQDSTEKTLLAQSAAGLVSENSCIYIDAGTTNLAIAENLPEDMPLTVVTNSPDIASVLLRKSRIHTVLLGGVVSRAVGGSVGHNALQQLKSIVVDQAFIGGCAFDLDTGLTGFDLEDCEFKRNAIILSKKTVVALTASKIQRVARFTIVPAAGIDVLVVPDEVTPDVRKMFTDAGIDVVLK